MPVRMRVVVVGLGYVGLPLAVQIEGAGHAVVGIDADQRKIASLVNKRSYIEDVADIEISAMLDRGRFRPTANTDDVGRFDVAVITVPTPLRDTSPDLSFVRRAAEGIARHIRPGSTVVLESTTYPGTTEEVLVPILERGSGLQAGQDFFVGFSPERIDPGNTRWNLRNTPKVVSGVNEASLEKVAEFYQSFVDTVVPTSSPREAELAKLIENTFRHVNIALVNELAMYASELGINIWEALEAADSKPFGFMKFVPGPGVGGHCLPIDPSYLSWQVKRALGRDFRFVGLANDINNHMPDFVVQRAMEILNASEKSVRGAQVLLMGLAYKRDSGDCRESPANRIIDLLRRFGADVSACDPHVEESQWPEGVTEVSLADLPSAERDLTIVVTDHSLFDYSHLSSEGGRVLDTRNVVKDGRSSLF